MKCCTVGERDRDREGNREEKEERERWRVGFIRSQAGHEQQLGHRLVGQRFASWPREVRHHTIDRLFRAGLSLMVADLIAIAIATV